MDALVAEGVIRLGGRLGDASRVLLVLAAAGEAEVGRRLDADAWTATAVLRIASVDRWQPAPGRAAAVG